MTGTRYRVCYTYWCKLLCRISGAFFGGVDPFLTHRGVQLHAVVRDENRHGSATDLHGSVTARPKETLQCV